MEAMTINFLKTKSWMLLRLKRTIGLLSKLTLKTISRKTNKQSHPSSARKIRLRKKIYLQTGIVTGARRTSSTSFGLMKHMVAQTLTKSKSNLALKLLKKSWNTRKYSLKDGNRLKTGISTLRELTRASLRLKSKTRLIRQLKINSNTLFRSFEKESRMWI